MNLLNTIRNKVQNAFTLAGFENAQTLVRLSDRPDIGDYQSNGALPLAKELKQNPRAVADKIADVLRTDSFFESISVDGPGFINMKISANALSDMAYEVLATKSCGYERADTPQTVVLDYGGPNIAKALHVGHLRSAVIGEALKRLCKFAGDKTIGDIHMGDWGLPMGLIITSLQEKYPSLPYFDENFTGEYPPLPFNAHELEVIYPMASKRSKEDEVFMALAKENTRLLQNGQRGFIALWQGFTGLSISEMKKIYDELNVSFDLWHGESHVHDRLQNMIKRLRDEGTIIPDDGAEIIRLGQSKSGNDLPPLIMVKSDGAVMYGATDLATIEARVEEFNPDRIWYAVDARQSLHFEQVFAGANIAGLTAKVKLEHLGFGTVNGKDNKPFKTRDGGVMTLRMLIDLATAAALRKMESGEMGRDLTDTEKAEISKIVGISALKFADLMNERMKNYIFDEDKLTSTEGKTGPYILYAIVRMKSILEKMDVSPDITAADIVHIGSPAERTLMLRLYALPEAIQTAYDNRAPHVICDYLFKVAQDFNAFYHDCPIKDADTATRNSRLALTKYTLHVMSTMVDILGLKIPNKM